MERPLRWIKDMRQRHRLVTETVFLLLGLTFISGGLLWWWGLGVKAIPIVVSTVFIFSLPVPFLYLLHDKIQRPVVDIQIKKGLEQWKMSEKYSELRTISEETIAEHSFYWPVVLATVVTFLGWLIVLLSTGTQTWNEATSLQMVVQNLTANAPPVTFGFLGAYFFSNQYLMRRFLREDLKPQPFTQVAIRVLSSMVIAYVISVDGLVPTDVQVPTRWTICALAFLAGITPYEIVLWIQGRISWLAKLPPREVEAVMRLDQIQGLTRWDEARLIEEGVENLQHLASASPLELLVRTRFGAERIRDWIDQAYLLIHLNEKQRMSFKDHHIRTATDFLKVYENKTLSMEEIPTADILASSIQKGPNSQFLMDQVKSFEKDVKKGAPATAHHPTRARQA